MRCLDIIAAYCFKLTAYDAIANRLIPSVGVPIGK